MSRTNETRHIEWCKWVDASVCNKKKRWNRDKRRIESK